MENGKRVLIVGCGIGGATAAYALARKGFEVDCIEAKPERPQAGAGICLLSNSMRALGEIGLAEPCYESGLGFEVFRQFDSAGRLLATLPAPPSCGIRRSELARILETAAEQAGVNLTRGTSVETLKDCGDAVEVTFKDGREKTYDLVVAADGVYSSLRQSVFGSEFAPKFAGQSGWRFSAPRPAEVDGFCLFRTDTGSIVGSFPTSKETCYLFFLDNSKEPFRIPEDRADQLMRERLSNFTAPFITESVKYITDPQQIIFRPLDITLVPAPWHRGRVVLLGDSAHAPTPQMTSGGGMAIEDALVLTDSLDESRAIEEALHKYSARRFDRVKTIFDASLQLSLNEQQDPLGNRDKSAALLMKTYKFLDQPW